MLRRRTGWILAGLLLALLFLTASRWLAPRSGIAPPRDGSLVAMPSAVYGAQATSTKPALPMTSAETESQGAGAIDPDQARCLEAWRQIVRQRASQLATRADADSQMASVLLDAGLPRSGAAAIEAAYERWHRSLAWALELAPGDPLLATHAHRLCTRDERCDALQSLDVLEASDPGNVWTWVAVLAQAQANGNEAGIGRALERAARSDAARSYHGQTALRILDQFGEPDLPSDCVRRLGEGRSARPATPADLVDIAVGANALVASPSIRPLLAACPSNLRDRRRHALCIGSLAHVAAGETLLEQMVATSRLVQLTAGAEEGAAWRERYRNLQWLQAQVIERRLYEQTPPLEWWTGGEVRVMQERLRAARAWPAPPGWLPEGADARALVVTGRHAPQP